MLTDELLRSGGLEKKAAVSKKDDSEKTAISVHCTLR